MSFILNHYLIYSSMFYGDNKVMGIFSWEVTLPFSFFPPFSIGVNFFSLSFMIEPST